MVTGYKKNTIITIAYLINNPSEVIYEIPTEDINNKPG